jgi:MFS family permease
MHYSSLERNTLVAATLSNFLMPFIASSVVVALPAIARDLNIGARGLSWVSTAYLLTASLLLIPFGRLSDIYGRKRVFQWGILIQCISSAGAVFAGSGGMLIVCRVVQGIGGAMIFGTGVTIVTSVFPPAKRGSAIGVVIAAVFVGLSAGPFIGGFLTTHLGWESVFLCSVLLCIVILTITLWKLKGEWAEARGERFDVAGSCIYVAALAAAMYGFSLLPAARGFFLLCAGAAGIVLFVGWERRVAAPLLEIGLFAGGRTFLFSNLATLINYSATFAVGFLVSLYLQYIRGFSPQTAGIILVSQPVVQAVLSPVAGRLSDRFEARILAAWGMALTVAGLAFFALMEKETGLGLIVLNLALLGSGLALFVSPNTNIIMGSVDRKYLGVASGTLATMRLAGGMMSMGTVMIMFGLFRIADVMITPQYHGQFLRSLKAAFTVFALSCFAGIFACLRKEKTAAPDALPEDEAGKAA